MQASKVYAARPQVGKKSFATQTFVAPPVFFGTCARTRRCNEP